MKSAMILAAMLALSGLLAVATATDKVEAKTSYSGGSKYKHYNYPKKHYEPKYEKHDNYDNGYKGDYHKDDYHKDEYYQGDYQPYYETYEPDYDPSYNGPKHYKTKTFRLFTREDPAVCGPISENPAIPDDLACNGNIDSAGITRKLYATDNAMDVTIVATLYQVGTVAVAGPQNGARASQGRMVWQQSFHFADGSTIQTQGDDSGPANSHYSNRAITGGTGRYAGATGYVTRSADPSKLVDYDPENYFEFVFLNWNGYGYGY